MHAATAGVDGRVGAGDAAATTAGAQPHTTCVCPACQRHQKAAGEDTVSVDPLLDYDDPYELMFSLAESGDVDGVESLLDMEPNLYLDQQRDRDGDTALIIAARHAHDAIVELLCDEGAGVGIQNDIGRTALHEAAVKGQVETCLILCRRGADLLARDDKGCTPLCRAVVNDHVRAPGAARADMLCKRALLTRLRVCVCVCGRVHRKPQRRASP